MSTPELTKVASDAFFSELVELVKVGAVDPSMLKLAEGYDVEDMLKEALNLAGVGQGLKSGLQNARAGLNTAAARISPTLAKPVSQVAHGMQGSQNSFVQGVGNILHHKSTSVGKGVLGLANPVGSAAEMLAGGVGNSAAKGLSSAGGALQKATGAVDDVWRQGRAMTPKGRLMNRLEAVGGGMKNTFTQGGTGHNVLTKHMPLAAEIGGAVGVGSMLHAPVGLAGVMGKAGLVGLGKAAPVIGAAMEHAPGAVDALAHKVAPAMKGVGGMIGHGVEDVVGTLKQNFGANRLGRMAGGAPAMGH